MSLELASFARTIARDDDAVFAALVLRDERTSEPVRLADFQRRMVSTWGSCRRSVTFAPSEHGKSNLLAAHVARRIGRDPSLRVGLLSGTREQAIRLLRLVSLIVHGPGFASVFPHRAVERATADELVLSGRPGSMKDPTVIAASFDLSSLLGSRLDLAVCDDVVSREDTFTPTARDRAWQGFLSVTASRLAPDGALHAVGTAEHSDDILHRLARLPGTVVQRFPTLDENGAPIWPERWSRERIEARRVELGPVGFRRAMMCEAIDASSLVFDEAHVENAIALGRSEQLSPVGCRSIIAVDPAWTVGAGSDESGIVLVAVDDEGFRYVSHVEGLRVRHDALASRVIDLARSSRAIVYAESNGAGGVIADAIGKRVPCRALPTTATSKRARVEALSAELASGRWIFRNPSGTPGPELRKLCGELLNFTWESHTGDRASALLLACEAVRALESRPRVGFVQINVHPYAAPQRRSNPFQLHR